MPRYVTRSHANDPNEDISDRGGPFRWNVNGFSRPSVTRITRENRSDSVPSSSLPKRNITRNRSAIRSVFESYFESIVYPRDLTRFAYMYSNSIVRSLKRTKDAFQLAHSSTPVSIESLLLLLFLFLLALLILGFLYASPPPPIQNRHDIFARDIEQCRRLINERKRCSNNR